MTMLERLNLSESYWNPKTILGVSNLSEIVKLQFRQNVIIIVMYLLKSFLELLSLLFLKNAKPLLRQPLVCLCDHLS